MLQTTLGQRVNLLGMTEEQLTEYMTHFGSPSYRARQIMRWIYQQAELDIASMTDLPLALRKELSTQAYVHRPDVQRMQQSGDGTVKFLMELHDGVTIEAVLIRDEQRLTACISSQAGCGIGCSFCATGLGGLHRNLTSAEIVGQLVTMQQRLGQERLTNVVLMGMGEPLANYRSVLAAIRLMIHPLGLAIGQRHITLSTSGIAPGIHRLAGEGMQIGLALSLHAPTDELRDQLVPINKKYPIATLMQACQAYIQQTGRRITMEYVMIRGVNDTLPLAKTLGQLLRPLLCHVNLIPLNPVPETGLHRSESEQIRRFAEVVSQSGVAVTVRKEMGTDIDAACGQLRRRAAEIQPTP